MAKLRGKITPGKIKALRGKVDVYWHKTQGWIARAWPCPHQPSPSPAWQKTAANFAMACAYFDRATPGTLDSWRRLDLRGQRTWADMLRSSALSAPPDCFQILNPEEVTITRVSATHVNLHIVKDPSQCAAGRNEEQVWHMQHVCSPIAPLQPILTAGAQHCQRYPRNPTVCPIPPPYVPIVPVNPGPCIPFANILAAAPVGASNINFVLWSRSNHDKPRLLTGICTYPLP